MRNGLKLAIALSVPFALAFGVFFALSFRLSLPRTRGEVPVTGLEREVRVVRDGWGVPHVFASGETDLFFAAGYVQAQDRLWEMDMMRRLGFGRLSEIVGPAGLEWDEAARALGFKECVLRDRSALTPDMAARLRAFAAGVNAWMDSRPSYAWPPEFMLLAYRPEPWSVEDSLVLKPLLALGLDADALDEILRTKILLAVGPERARTILPEGVAVPDDPEILRVLAEAKPDFAGFLERGASNNWAVSGARTVTGKPLLANDPHLALHLPAYWYEMHLDCPALRSAGATFPGLPLVVIGRNADAAWGITDAFADTEDLYFERLDGSGTKYRDGDAWRPLAVKKESIKVRWRRKAKVFDVPWTERGPVISPAVARSGLPLSLRWTAHEGGRSFEGIYRLNLASSWDEFKKAVALIDSPAQNFVFAGRGGDIGWYLNGRIPIRPRTAALFPYPGWKPEGRWTGFLGDGENPSVLNPARGFLVTANDKVVPSGYPHYLGESWLLPFRAERIAELLSGDGKLSADDMREIQNDILSKQAELVLPFVLGTPGLSGRALEARDMLAAWDRRPGAGAASVLFEFFMDDFSELTFADELGDIFKGMGEMLKQEPALLYRVLAERDSPWFDDVKTPRREIRDDILGAALARSYKRLERKYGSPANWDWRRIHALRLRHPLGGFPLFGFFNAGTFPLAGDAATVQAAYPLKNYRTGAAASFRMIVDLGEPQRSVAVLPAGESGHFLSRHYLDQLPLWLDGAYHPLLFERDDVEKAAESVLILKPSGKGT